MRFRTIAIVTALSAGLAQTGAAFAPRKGAEPQTVAEGRPARAHRDVAWKTIGDWRVIMDRDTDVPLRMWGKPIAAPRANSDAAAADSAARQFITTNLETIAPGASAKDFTLLVNRVDGNLRTVTFAQNAEGLRVVGGALAFTFSHDRLIMVSSTALPNVSVRVPGGAFAAATLATSAKDWLRRDGYDVDVKAQGQRVIVPVVHARGNASTPQITYEVAEELTVESSGRGVGLWTVWLDAASAKPIARHQNLMFASGKVLFDTPDRWPGGGRSGHPAPEVVHTIGAGQVTSMMDGTVTWADAGAVQITLGLAGPHVKITNKQGALATDTMTLNPDQTITWSKASDEFADAQLISFIAVSTAKNFVRTRLNANLTWLDGQIPVTVNENQTCNAYSTGNDIHFFKSGTQCENTGRITDVVYHEFGHSVHAQSIIPGEGAFDGSLSEGLADTLAASITGDHGMGRGFFRNNEALRELDPTDKELKWPDDADGEVHDEGEIIGEALWDVRKALEGKYGAADGFEKFLKLYYGVVQRASDIPSSYAAALVADDDDGDLSNGTPNICLLNTAFGLHGLADPTVTLGLAAPKRDGFQVSMTLKAPTQTECPPPGVQSATLTWMARGGTPSDVQLAINGENLVGNIPTQPDGTVVLYHVTVTLEDGSSISYPQNPADKDYQFYVGNVTKLWCADFEAGLGDWTTSANPTSRNDWEVAAPAGLGGDPKSAYAGTNVLGTDVGAADDGVYWTRAQEWVESPEIDLQGNTAVRLQYYRWLNVEDAAYDHATIYANDAPVWSNYATPGMNPTDETNHTDKEWRFQDVDLAAQATSGKIKLKFDIKSDEGLELGGWNVDEVCIVMAGPPSTSTCGNHNVDEGETCDDGNTVDGDECPADCGMSATTDDPGCCSAGTNPAGAMLLSLATLGLVVVRRRRRK
jgi:MYXO-CTERM domain-containing protein